MNYIKLLYQKERKYGVFASVNIIQEKMNIERELEVLKNNKIKIWEENGKIHYEGPEMKIDAALISFLKEFKEDILSYLKEEQKDFLTPTHNQMGLFMEQKSNINSFSMYNVVAKILKKDVEFEQLSKYIQRIINRHEALRSVFVNINGEINIQILDDIYPVISIKDLMNYSKEEILNLVMKDVYKPFNYEGGILFKVLCYNSDYGKIIVLCGHHLITDAVSFNIILKEIEEQICAIDDIQDSLPVLHGFREYMLWENKYDATIEYQKNIEFWKKLLDKDICPVTLPIIKNKTEEGYKTGILKRWLDEDLSAEIKRCANEVGVTAYIFLLSALIYLVDSVMPNENGKNIIGIFSANRFSGGKDYTNAVGYFSNLLPFPILIDRKNSYRELINQTRKQLYMILEHQEIPYSLLVKELNPCRSENRNSLFNIVFDSLLFYDRKANKEECFSSFDIDQGAGEFDLLIWVREEERRFRFDLRYNDNLFFDYQIEYFFESFHCILNQIVNGLDIELNEVEIVPQVGLKCMCENNSSEVPVVGPTLEKRVFQYAVSEPYENAVFSEYSGKKLTYMEVKRRALEIADYLRKKGIGHQDKVVVSMRKNIDFIPAVIAIWKLGAIYIPLDPFYPSDRKKSVLKNINPSVVIFDKISYEKLVDYPYFIVSEIEMVKKEIVDDFIGSSMDDIAYIIHTSGSTGVPKGVKIKHSSLCNLLQYLAEKLRISKLEVFSSLSPISFDLAISEMFLPLFCGSRLIMVEINTVRDSNRLYEMLKSNNVTIMHGTPATYEILADSCFEKKFLKIAICAGEQFDNSLVKKMRELSYEIYNMYGPAETTVFSTVYKFLEDDQIVSIGKPINNTRIWILNQHLQRMPCFVPGEIYIGGEGVMQGYNNFSYNFLHNDKAYLIGERWYKSGDWGYYLPDGNIRLLGRRDDQVKIRGHRIELLEISSALKELYYVRDAVVIVDSRRENVKKLIGFVAMNESYEFDQEMILSYMNKKLPDYMIPNTVLEIDQIPLNRSGKIDKKELLKFATIIQEKAESNEFGDYSEVEKAIYNIWVKILGTSSITLDSNFFDLGGDSLLLSKMRNDIENILGERIQIVDLFKYTTIREIAQYFSKGDNTEGERNIASKINKRDDYLKRRNKKLS